MMAVIRDWGFVVASLWCAFFALVGVIGCSGEEGTEPMVEMSEAVPARTVEVKVTVIPSATVARISELTTATFVPRPAVLESTATVVVEVDAERSIEDGLDLVALTDRAYELTIMLAEELSPRRSASGEELRGAMFLLREMMELGYNAELQIFDVTEAAPAGSIEVFSGPDGHDSGVQFSRSDGDTSRIFFLPFEPSKIGRVTGELVYVGLGTDVNFEGVDVDGKIALMSRGALTLEEKETNAAERGAVGVVVFNNEHHFYFGGRLEQEPDILAGGIPKEDGEKLRDALKGSEMLDVELLVYPDGNGPSRNVIAELNNDIVDDSVLVIGAHYDTTPWSAGANDNGSGVAAALTLAEELADDELPFDLRFVFFGSEETGLHGSNYYAGELSQAELDRILAMINLDVVATGDLQVFGDESLAKHADYVANDLDIDLSIREPFEWGASDYVAFDERAVPFMMFHADNFSFINHPSDTLEHVEAEPIGNTVAIVLGVVSRLVDSIAQ